MTRIQQFHGRRILRLEKLRRHLVSRAAAVRRACYRCKIDPVRLQDFNDTYHHLLRRLLYKLDYSRQQYAAQ